MNPQDFTDTHGIRYATTSTVRRISVKQFGNCSDATVRQFFFKPVDNSLRKADAAEFVNFQVRIQIRTDKPRPGSSLMVGPGTLFFITFEGRVVSAAFRAQGAQSF